MNTKSQGFTLVEILVSLALLSVIATATFGLLPGLARSNSATRDEQRVTLVAKSFFEQTAAFYATSVNYDQDPPAPEGTVDGLACSAPAVTSLSTNTAGQTTLKRVVLSCTLLGRTSAFQRDFARP